MGGLAPVSLFRVKIGQNIININSLKCTNHPHSVFFFFGKYNKNKLECAVDGTPSQIPMLVAKNAKSMTEGWTDIGNWRNKKKTVLEITLGRHSC